LLRSFLGTTYLFTPFCLSSKKTGHLENAAGRALRFSNLSLKALRHILENGLDRMEEKKDGANAALPAHDNIRGGQYYH
jgi:hypothetical protein